MMPTRIQNTTVKKDLTKTVLSFRLTPTEAARFWKVMDEAKRKNPYVSKTDVIRELVGLAPPQAVTPAQIAFFRDSGLLGAEIKVTTEQHRKKRGTG